MSKTTSCKECLFAKYKDVTQLDCVLSKLDLYKKHNYLVKEAYDEEKEFYIIPNKWCYWYRDNKWKHKDLSLTNQLKQTKKELQITYNVIVFYKDDVKDLRKTLQSLKDSILQTQHITVVRQISSNTTPSKLIDIIKDYGISWRLQNNIHDKVSKEEAIDLCIDIIHYNYYIVCDAGYWFSDALMNTINWKIFNQLYTFIGALPDDNNITILSYILHKTNNGNAEKPLLDKINTWAYLP